MTTTSELCNMYPWGFQTKSLYSTSSPPSAALMRQWTGSVLLKIMACRLFGAMSMSNPVLRLLWIGPLGTNFSEILIKIQNVSFTKIHLKLSSAKWRHGGNELMKLTYIYLHQLNRAELFGWFLCMLIFGTEICLRFAFTISTRCDFPRMMS